MREIIENFLNLTTTILNMSESSNSEVVKLISNYKAQKVKFKGILKHIFHWHLTDSYFRYFEGRLSSMEIFNMKWFFANFPDEENFENLYCSDGITREQMALDMYTNSFIDRLFTYGVFLGEEQINSLHVTLDELTRIIWYIKDFQLRKDDANSKN